MKQVKKFGVACVLAVAMLALAGVSSAAAEQSTFCKVNETPCSAANHYSTGTAFILKSKGFLVWTSYFSGFEMSRSECIGEMQGKTTTTGSSVQPVEVSITGTSLLCNDALIAYQLPKMKFDWTKSTMNASVTTTGFVFRFPEAGCTYTGAEIKEGTTLNGGNPAILTFKEVPVTPSEICGETGKFSGEFEVVSPKPLYVSNS